MHLDVSLVVYFQEQPVPADAEFAGWAALVHALKLAASVEDPGGMSVAVSAGTGRGASSISAIGQVASSSIISFGLLPRHPLVPSSSNEIAWMGSRMGQPPRLRTHCLYPEDYGGSDRYGREEGGVRIGRSGSRCVSSP